ncbi:MAG: hypothetical protein KIT85_14440 [Pseudolabrys sp.]|nr:hypothetical protein [Pseudolabrys sp.]
MALLAEQLVDEWLNRNGFFTLRGIKKGGDEIDLLGVRERNGVLEGWHVEVQASFRPVSYIAKLSKEAQERLGVKSATSAKKRPPDMIDEAIVDWVEKKFRSKKKEKMRAQCWREVKWAYKFVHAEVHDKSELEALERQNIDLIPLEQVLRDLCNHKRDELFGAAGTDIAELIRYFAVHSQRQQSSY